MCLVGLLTVFGRQDKFRRKVSDKMEDDEENKNTDDTATNCCGVKKREYGESQSDGTYDL